MKYLKIVLCLSFIFLLTGCKKDVKFSLEEKYYNESSLNVIDTNELEYLINNKESFALFVYQPLCETSSGFESILNNFIKQHNMSFYKISFSNIKDTKLGKKIKYYPSFVIYKDGKVVDYLEANKDEDTNYYKDINEFRNWLSNYINLGELNLNYSKDEDETLEKFEIDVKVDNISYNENKVNIYMFWGDGCPHCEHAKSFFDSIESEYGKYFTLNKFEVWYNEENAEIYRQFAAKMGDKKSGVPYIIIGNKTFKGFSKSYEESIKEAITSQYKNSYDVYFSK